MAFILVALVFRLYITVLELIRFLQLRFLSGSFPIGLIQHILEEAVSVFDFDDHPTGVLEKPHHNGIDSSQRRWLILDVVDNGKIVVVYLP